MAKIKVEVRKDLILKQQSWFLTSYFYDVPLSLSQRITAQKSQGIVAESLRISMKNADQLTDLSKGLSQYTSEQDIAGWARKIESQAKRVVAGQDPEVMAAFKKSLKSAKDDILGEIGKKKMTPRLDKAYKKIITAAEKLNIKGLDIAVEKALDKKALSNAFRLAHTEIRMANNIGIYTRAMEDDDVVGFKIMISAAGSNCDDCERIAAAGIYSKGTVPAIPVHPHCRCELYPVYRLEDGAELITEVEGPVMESAPDELSSW